MFFQKSQIDLTVLNEILLKRYESEVIYLREQNKILMDRILALTNSNLYKEVKRQEHTELQIANSIVDEVKSRYSQTLDKEAEDKKEHEQKILKLQLNQMMTGSDV